MKRLAQPFAGFLGGQRRGGGRGGAADAVGVGHGDAVGAHGGDDAGLDVAVDVPVLAGDGVDDYPVDDVVNAKVGDALEDGLVDDEGGDGLVVAGCGGGLPDDGGGFVVVGGVRHGDLQAGHGELVGGVAHAQDLAVADVPQDAVDVTHGGQPQGEFFDGAGDAGGQVDLIADAKLVFQEHADAGQEVLDQGLGAKTEGDADDACGGDQGSNIHADGLEDVEDAEGPDDDGDGGLGHAGEGLHARLAALLLGLGGGDDAGGQGLALLEVGSGEGLGLGVGALGVFVHAFIDEPIEHASDDEDGDDDGNDLEGFEDQPCFGGVALEPIGNSVRPLGACFPYRVEGVLGEQGRSSEVMGQYGQRMWNRCEHF